MTPNTHHANPDCDCELPGANLDVSKMPGHWVLARLGKKVLRPGGLELTRLMLYSLAVKPADDVVEFAPGLGATARMTLAARPASYTAVERDATAAAGVRRWLDPQHGPRQVITGRAENTGLPDACASVVYGEAMLSMQAEDAKQRIVREAFRLLRPGGRYGIHELSLGPDDWPDQKLEIIRASITKAIRHRALPLTCDEWQALLRAEGFEVVTLETAPMALLEPGRMVRDEGWRGALRFFWRVLSDGAARARVREMRRTFRRHREHMGAICIIARKPLAAYESGA